MNKVLSINGKSIIDVPRNVDIDIKGEHTFEQTKELCEKLMKMSPNEMILAGHILIHALNELKYTDDYVHIIRYEKIGGVYFQNFNEFVSHVCNTTDDIKKLKIVNLREYYKIWKEGFEKYVDKNEDCEPVAFINYG